MEGILLVDKPEGWTSFDVVNHVRTMVARELGHKPRNVKVGHTGTLDPAATGLLVLCIGKKYTKKVTELIGHDKSYLAEITFGITSSTDDKEGELVKDASEVNISKEELVKVLSMFKGKIQQTPPIYSALKIKGKRAYQLAREGKEVTLKPRSVVIHTIELLDFNNPTAQIECSVGSGTYIRSLARDIGAKLGVGAYLSQLRRTELGVWRIEDAVQVEGLNIDIIKEKLLV